MAPSYQLPDLPLFVQTIELRTNPALCRAMLEDAEKWFSSPGRLPIPVLREHLSSMKIGLLAAVCFPSSDPNRLRFLADFLTVVVLFSEHIKETPQAASPCWNNVNDEDGIQTLFSNTFFHWLAIPCFIC
jgi:hypothetical protein